MHGADGVRKGNSKQDYLAYLLRLWRAGLGESAVWRASLQDPLTGQRMGFASLDDVVAFLKQKMGEEESRPVKWTEGNAHQKPS